MEKNFKKQANCWAEKLLSGETANAVAAYLEKLDDKKEAELLKLSDPVAYFSKSGDRMEELVFCLYRCGEVLENYRKRGIAEEIFFETFQEVKRWSDFYFNEHQRAGIAEVAWLEQLFKMRIFKIGCLEYEMGALEENNRYNLPAGKAVKIHIPAGTELDESSCKKSLKDARSFIAEYFPDYTESAFVCESWLLWPGLKKFLSDKSNIIGFQNLFDIVHEEETIFLVKFVFGLTDPNATLDGFVCKTSLQKKLLDYRASGGKFGAAYGIVKA